MLFWSIVAQDHEFGQFDLKNGYDGFPLTVTLRLQDTDRCNLNHRREDGGITNRFQERIKRSLRLS